MPDGPLTRAAAEGSSWQVRLTSVVLRSPYPRPRRRRIISRSPFATKGSSKASAAYHGGVALPSSEGPGPEGEDPSSANDPMTTSSRTLCRRPVAGLVMTLLALRLAPHTAVAQSTLTAAETDTSRIATENWLRTELPKIRVHYPEPIPPLDRTGPTRALPGDKQRPGPAPLPSDERIVRVKLDSCHLEIERHFDGWPRPDPIGVLNTIPLDQLDSAAISGEKRPGGRFEGNGIAIVMVETPTAVLQIVSIGADGRHAGGHSQRVYFPMPNLTTADAVAERIRRAAASCHPAS